MPCSLCKQEGHNKRSCTGNTVSVQEPLEPVKRRSNSLDFYTDSSIAPSSADTYWLLYGKHGDIHGKWMLFYDKSRIDAEWKKIKQLYDESKLGNVISMKCSGAKENPRSSDKNTHVIIIYCADDNGEIMNTGRRIIENLVDYSNAYIYYKSNSQSKEGVAASGQPVNHLHRLPIKAPDTSHYWQGGISKREMRNMGPKEGYCGCGRREEEGSYGCTRYPTCVNVSGEDTWY